RAACLYTDFGEGIRAGLADRKVVNMWPGLTSLQQKMMSEMNCMHADCDDDVSLGQQFGQAGELAARCRFKQWTAERCVAVLAQQLHQLGGLSGRAHHQGYHAR